MCPVFSVQLGIPRDDSLTDGCVELLVISTRSLHHSRLNWSLKWFLLAFPLFPFIVGRRRPAEQLHSLRDRR